MRTGSCAGPLKDKDGKTAGDSAVGGQQTLDIKTTAHEDFVSRFWDVIG